MSESIIRASTEISAALEPAAKAVIRVENGLDFVVNAEEELTMKRQRIAYHEAGHAVIGRALGLVCGEASIKPNSDGSNLETYGYSHIENPLRRWERGDGPRRALADAFCMALYAGAEAERYFFGSQEVVVGDGPDQERATGCLTMVGIPGAAYVQDDVWEGYEQRLRRQSQMMVRRYNAAIDRVAKALLEWEALSSDKIDVLIREDVDARFGTGNAA